MRALQQAQRLPQPAGKEPPGRLANLRTVVPVFAQELAATRRELRLARRELVAIRRESARLLRARETRRRLGAAR